MSWSYYVESTYIESLIFLSSPKAYIFHSVDRFIDDVCGINDSNKFSVSFKDIYPEELELKVEHSDTHATFLDFDITIKDGMFIYKLFDKRNSISFSNASSK